MEDLIEVRLSGYHNTQELHSTIKNFYIGIVEDAIRLNLWDSSISGIIITDNFLQDLEKQAESWNIRTGISQEKEYSVASKILFNHNLHSPEYIIFVDFHILSRSAPHSYQVTFGQILSIFARHIIPHEVRDQNINAFPITLEENIKSVSIEWCISFYRKQLENNIIDSTIDEVNPNKLLIAFKRKLKNTYINIITTSLII